MFWRRRKTYAHTCIHTYMHRHKTHTYPQRNITAHRERENHNASAYPVDARPPFPVEERAQLEEGRYHVLCVCE